jgi:xyloglucan-specific exo-beta-1,4-glucanase
MLRSTDRGATWAKTELPVKIGGNEDGRNTGERLMVDPAQGAVLFLGAKDGLYRSADHGATWSRVEAFPKVHVTLVAFDPVEKTKTGETAIVYAGFATARGGGLLVSTDGGATWGLIDGQPKGLVPHHLALDAKGVLYIAYGNGLGPNGVTDGAVWTFDPDSGAWTDISPVKPDGSDVFGYGGLSLDPAHPGVIVVSTLDRWGRGDDLFRSTDGGKTWKGLREKSEHDAAARPGCAAWKARPAAPWATGSATSTSTRPIPTRRSTSPATACGGPEPDRGRPLGPHRLAVRRRGPGGDGGPGAGFSPQ